MYKFKLENNTLLDLVQISGADCREAELNDILLDVCFNENNELLVFPSNEQVNYLKISENKKLMKIAKQNVEELLMQDDFDFFTFAHSKYMVDGIVDENGLETNYLEILKKNKMEVK